MNKARKAAIAQLNKDVPGSAVFIATGDLKKGYRGGFHFEARVENYIQIGWRAAQAVMDNGFLGKKK